MSVWFVIPSKRPLNEANACLDAWQLAGYKVGVLREQSDGMLDVNLQLPVAGYIGWARSVNLLTAHVMGYDPSAEWFVTGGDDYWPDPNHTADEIARECGEHFAEVAMSFGATRTFGVMQPTGDRWGEQNCFACQGRGWLLDLSRNKHDCPRCHATGKEATIDRIAGSPWMGREFCRRMYHGSGPMYNGFYHNFADEHLQRVARKLGVFWQRRDLIQEHRHWARPRGDWLDAPEWAKKINDPRFSDWDRSKALFKKLEAGGFREADDLLPAEGV